MNQNFLLFCLILAFSVTAQAGKPDEVSGKGTKDVFEIVKTARQFAIGGTGVAGTLSGEEVAFRQLLKQPEPIENCQKLLTEGTPAGQLYGLLGLRGLDEPAFQKVFPRYSNSKTTLETISGCMRFQATSAQIAKQIGDGDFK